MASSANHSLPFRPEASSQLQESIIQAESVTRKRKLSELIPTPPTNPQPNQSLHERRADDELEPPSKKREEIWSGGEEPESHRITDWVSRLPTDFDGTFLVSAEDHPSYDRESMTSTASSSDLKRNNSHTSFSTYHPEFDHFLKDANIHDLDPDLKPQHFDHIQHSLTHGQPAADFSDGEWEDKFKSWHRYADKHAGEESLKAMHHALLPRSSMDLPPPHRWDIDLKWKTFIWKDKRKGFNYKPDYYVGLETNKIQSQFLEDSELSTYFRPHRAGAVFPHTVAEFKSSFGKHHHAIGQIRYGGAACARTTLLLRGKIFGEQDCYNVPLSTSYTITPEGFRCFVHFCRVVDEEIHYYPARILNLTMGANWKEFRHNLRQLWKFLEFGRSIRETDLKRLEEAPVASLLTSSSSMVPDSQLADLDDQDDVVANSEDTSAGVSKVSDSSGERVLSSPQADPAPRRRQFNAQIANLNPCGQ